VKADAYGIYPPGPSDWNIGYRYRGLFGSAPDGSECFAGVSKLTLLLRLLLLLLVLVLVVGDCRPL